MNLETKITIYKFTPQLFTLTLEFINGIRFRARKTYKKMFSERKRKGTSGQRIFGSAESVPSDTK